MGTGGDSNGGCGGCGGRDRDSRVVILVVIKYWNVSITCLHFSGAVGYYNFTTIIAMAKNESEMVSKRNETGQEIVSILSIGIMAFLAIFSGTLTS